MMGFLDSYKRLEKLCGEVMNDERKISAYIDEMQNKPNGSYKVPGWDKDLKQLKHYRWIRNKIAHEPDCTEKNMCEPGDARWLDEFYSRIINQKDPLSLYRKAIRSAPRRSNSKQTTKNKKKNRFLIIFIIVLFAVLVGLGLLYTLYLLGCFNDGPIETIYEQFRQIID